jgi:hypothetical protein
MKRFALVVVFTSLAILIGCPKVEQDARDSAAGLNGAIAAAQSKYQASCTANSKQQVCTLINQAVSAQNALITATEAYCGWSTAAPPPDPTATCVPVKNAQAGLTSAIANANSFILQLKGAL